MRKTRFNLIAAMLVLFLILTGCAGGAGNTNSGNDNGGAAASGQDSGQNSGQDSAQQPENESPQVRTIPHTMGEAKIEGVPQRVVALEWTYAEDLLALGIVPVGVADIEGYKSWVNAEPPLPDTVVDVGTRQEPNLETIMSLKPDLIITAGNRAANNYEQLNAIAPTLVFDPYIEPYVNDQYAEMIESFNVIADVLDKKEEAEQILADLEKTYEEAKAALESAGKAGETFVLTQAFSNQNAAVLRLFTDNSVAAAILNKLGLTNAYQADKLEAYGFSNATVESLPALQEANFFYVVQDSDNVFENQLKDNKVWNSLDFVREGRLYPLGGDMWLFGGPISAKIFADKVVELLTR